MVAPGAYVATVGAALTVVVGFVWLLIFGVLLAAAMGLLVWLLGDAFGAACFLVTGAVVGVVLADSLRSRQPPQESK